MIAIAVNPIATPISVRCRPGLATARIALGVLRSSTQVPAMTINTASPAASIRYSCQWIRRAAAMSASVREFGIEGHPTVDKQSDAVDVVAIVGSKPDGGARDVVGFADAFVGHQPRQRVVRLGG